MNNLEKLEERLRPGDINTPFLTLEAGKQMFACVLDRLDRIEASLSPLEGTYESIAKIQKRFGLNYYRAEALCKSPGVRTSGKTVGGYPRYNVADCARVYAGESLSTNPQTAGKE